MPPLVTPPRQNDSAPQNIFDGVKSRCRLGISTCITIRRPHNYYGMEEMAIDPVSVGEGIWGGGE